MEYILKIKMKTFFLLAFSLATLFLSQTEAVLQYEKKNLGETHQV
jgi:hypothetical protein